MGLTFTQKFLQVPRVYLIRFLEPGDMESTQAIVGIIPVPENDTVDFHEIFESQGYWLECVDLHDIAIEGSRILEELDIRPDYEYEW